MNYKYLTCIKVLTNVNNCKNFFVVTVCTSKPLTDKDTCTKVRQYLLKEYSIEGMYDMEIFDEKHSDCNTIILTEKDIDRYFQVRPNTPII